LIECCFINVRKQSYPGKDTGIIKGEVQPAVGFDRGPNEVLNLLRVTHVRFDKERITTLLLDRLSGFASLQVHVADDNLGAMACK
jgi:hypothetical protein